VIAEQAQERLDMVPLLHPKDVHEVVSQLKRVARSDRPQRRKTAAEFRAELISRGLY